jgi:NAD(P)H-dependent flavin oxidoreductase YrpB (nitropropane dioxygenase family)
MSKWTDTRVTRNLGISYPILQGPFGRGGSTAKLAATVSNLGGESLPAEVRSHRIRHRNAEALFTSLVQETEDVLRARTA